MADYFVDTSALGKHYHEEVGTARVDQLLGEPQSRHFVSRLSVIEVGSVFAGKVRNAVISQADFDLLRRRFLTDVTQRQVQRRSLFVQRTRHPELERRARSDWPALAPVRSCAVHRAFVLCWTAQLEGTTPSRS
ncbi:type II toxin-antitoxin system VapC family toxin [Acidobacteria bacterium AH-259-L09]|nr:type II toxin-antitoxin system VapC family toxin [Acidobacteria bacterium AH-259-L09]